MNISFLSRRKYAANTAATFGLQYKEDVSCTVPNASKNTITVPPYQYDFTTKEENEWWASLIHECYHHAYPDDFLFLESKKIKKQNLLVMMNNLVCDHKIERNQHGNFAGRDKIMDSNQVDIVRQILNKGDVATQIAKLLKDGNIEEAPTKEQIEKMQEQADKIEAALNFDVLSRKMWQPGMGAVANKFNSDKSMELFEALVDEEGLLDDYYSAYTPEEQWDVARRMVNILEEDSDEADKQEEQAQQGAGDGQGASESGEEGEGNGMVQGEGDEAAEALAGASQILYDDLDFTKHEEKHGQPSFSPMKIIYGEMKHEEPYNITTPIILSFEDGTAQAHYGRGNQRSGDVYRSGIDAVNTGKSLSQEVRKHLIVAKRGHWEGNKKRGKIHKRSVWKIKTYSGMPQAQNVFKNKVVRNIQDAAISIVVDQSGSMGGDKYIHAAHSAVLLNEVFGQLQVPVEIISFTDTYEPVNIIHKSFDAAINNYKLVEQFVLASSEMGGNSDGDSIMFAADRLMQRNEKKRIMIVLSDGQPAGSQYGCDAFTYKVVKHLENVIDIHGIGLMSYSVERYYKSHDVIRSSDELEKALLNVLKHKVFK